MASRGSKAAAWRQPSDRADRRTWARRLLAQATGPVGGLLADAISFGVSFCCLTALRAPRDRRSEAPAAGGMLDGLRFAWRDPYLRTMTAFSSLANLALTGVDALLVVFLSRTVGLSSAAAGLVMASLGGGGVLGALVARPLGRRFGTARAMLISVAGGLCFALLLPIANKGPRLAFASIAMMPVGALLAGGLATVLGLRGALWILTALIAASGLLYLHFRKKDRDSMSFALDLWSYQDVKAAAGDILERVSNGSMPCGGAWPKERVDVFSRWTATQMQP
jgi:Na+/melibiose symporter-like transporter